MQHISGVQITADSLLDGTSLGDVGDAPLLVGLPVQVGVHALLNWAISPAGSDTQRRLALLSPPEYRLSM